jgi:phosphoglycerate dehydrogenase-like enzyme
VTGAPRRIHAYMGFGEAMREIVAAAFPEREYVVWKCEEEFANGIGEAEVLLANRPPRGHWGRARRLRLIQMVGAGVDSVLPAEDLAAAVRLANARGVHEPEMSEFALSLVLALAKRIPRALEQKQRRQWQPFGTHRLVGRTAAILGLGVIGRGIAARCKALGMRVIGTRRSGEPLDGVDAVYAPGETRRVLAEADVVVVVLPLTPETRGLIDADAFEAMKPRALLVDVARGGIVDEEALLQALASGKLGGAALDVFEEEPLPASSPLWDAPNLILTPHVAGLSREYMTRLGEIFLENVRRLESGGDLLNEIDRTRGY